MRLTDNPKRDVPIVLVIVLIVGAVLWPVDPSHPMSKATVYLNNVKQTGTATMIYLDDMDDRYPLRDVWMDALVPYTKNPHLFRCPSLPKGAYGYAFNGALAAARMPKEGDGATTPLLYDSVNPIRNASDLVTSLPKPGRHDERNTIGYADGHAKTAVR